MIIKCTTIETTANGLKATRIDGTTIWFSDRYVTEFKEHNLGFDIKLCTGETVDLRL